MNTVLKAFSLTCLAFFWVFFVIVALTYFQEEPLLPIIFEAVSAFGTVGLSLGITENLEIPSKVLLIISMLLGRVGVMSFALAIGMKDRDLHRRFPETDVMVG